LSYVAGRPRSVATSGGLRVCGFGDLGVGTVILLALTADFMPRTEGDTGKVVLTGIFAKCQ